MQVAMALRFGFWNIGKRPIGELVRRFALGNNLDIFVLAECPRPWEILKAVNSTGAGFNFVPLQPPPLDGETPEEGAGFIATPRVHVFWRKTAGSVRHLSRLPFGEAWELVPHRCRPVLLLGVHLPAKIGAGSSDHMDWANTLRVAIETIETAAANRRSLLVGDFNMNPFEDGMVGGLNGVMTRAVALKQGRKIAGEWRRFYFNPMWGLLGDRPESPPGTYYFDTSKPVNHYWNILDQLLVRPELIDSLAPDSVRILSAMDQTSLLKNGRPDTNIGSDHLPIVFELDLKE